jgi:hypothetical protein
MCRHEQVISCSRHSTKSSPSRWTAVHHSCCKHTQVQTKGDSNHRSWIQSYAFSDMYAGALTALDVTLWQACISMLATNSDVADEGVRGSRKARSEQHMCQQGHISVISPYACTCPCPPLV